jgi:hypothetical protein
MGLRHSCGAWLLLTAGLRLLARLVTSFCGNRLRDIDFLSLICSVPVTLLTENSFELGIGSRHIDSHCCKDAYWCSFDFRGAYSCSAAWQFLENADGLDYSQLGESGDAQIQVKASRTFLFCHQPFPLPDHPHLIAGRGATNRCQTFGPCKNMNVSIGVAMSLTYLRALG